MEKSRKKGRMGKKDNRRFERKRERRKGKRTCSKI